MIEPIIGLGELAISDHRSSHPSLDELGRLASEARVGGLLSGKAGIVNFHLGDAPAGLKPLEELVASGDMPRTQFLPTHCNRNPDLFVESLRWAKEGGFADVTTSTVQRYLDEGEVAASEAIRRFYEAGSIDQLTCTSDGQGSLPIFDSAGVLAGLTMGSSASLWKAVREAILKGGVPLAEAAKTVTSTPARALKLGRKGRLAVGADADILLVSRDGLEIRGLAAMGRILMKEGEVLVRGSFEAG